MGMLDSMLGQALGSSTARPGQAQQLANIVMGMLGNQKTGGVGGLLSMLTQKGLGDQVQSWISTGQNKPVSPEQITSALGEDRVTQIARETGLETRDASAGLAALIPGFVDKLTPTGTLPREAELDTGLAGLRRLYS